MYQFRQMAQAEEHNLHTVFDFREVLDGVDPAALRQGFSELFQHFIQRSDLAHSYRAWRRDGAADMTASIMLGRTGCSTIIIIIIITIVYNLQA